MTAAHCWDGQAAALTDGSRCCHGARDKVGHQSRKATLMSYQPNIETPHVPTRAAIIDLVSREEAGRGEGGLFAEESDLIEALQAIVARTGRAGLGATQGNMRDTLARVFAEFSY